MKRPRLNEDPDDYSTNQETKRRLTVDAPNEAHPSSHDQDAAFMEAMACSEVSVDWGWNDTDRIEFQLSEQIDEDMSGLGPEAYDKVDVLQHDSRHHEFEMKAAQDISPESEECSLEIVCFGTIPSLHGRCARSSSLSQRFSVTITSSERFHATDNQQVTGIIPPQYGRMVKSLLDENALILFAYCTIDTDVTQKHPSGPYSQISCTLDVTVYGPNDLFESIGSWLQDYDVYLQDPRTIDLDVKYRNPHRLSSTELSSCPSVSMVVWLSTDTVQFLKIEDRPEPLDMISGQDDLEETAAPKMIRTVLHRHQRQALTFMLGRERGWALETKGADVWEALDSSHDRKFINRILGNHQDTAPPPFYGGIIADPMGLGKTLPMVALAASDLEPGAAVVTEYDLLNVSEDPMPTVSATLVIVPQPLLSTWEEQIKDHIEVDGLKVRRHHGKERLSLIEQINAANIILTTYHTVRADWQKGEVPANSILFTVRWKRIILDEAHLVRNMKTRMARSICSLESVSRWAVTGTPIQNQLSDLTALLKFIRAYPYDDPKKFDTDISQLWKSGEDEEAVKRLKRLSRCLILRRAKHTITLPPRHDVRCPVEFSKAERALYDNIRNQTIIKMDDALAQDTDTWQRGLYGNFLQQIESMRLVCDLGLHYTSRHGKMNTREKDNWADDARQAFRVKGQMGTIRCTLCHSSLDVTESLGDDAAPHYTAHLFSCLEYACAECSYKNRKSIQKMPCGHTPNCPVTPILTGSSAFEEMSGDITEGLRLAHHSEFPSKIKALISDLEQPKNKDAKCIVFSTWRMTLDIIEAALEQAQIRSVRFDGKVAQTQRQPVLNEFKSNPNVRIILLTLECGAVGLTLTAASRAYMMEPHWNPTVEEQALARIHRIGQKSEVTTIRFYIRDSFEERVIETQEAKKNLASVLLSGHDGGQVDNSLGALQRLRSLL